MKKKIISVCLIMVMVLSCVSFNVHASNIMQVCLADLGCVDYGRYTGNMGDSCVFNLDQNGLPGMDNQYYRNGNIGVDGTVYNNGFEVWIARWNYGDDISWAYKTIDINGNFSKLTGSTGLIKSYNTTDFDSTVYFYDEETLLYSVRMTPNNWKHDFEIDITGVEQLTVMIMDNEEKAGGTSFALYDLFLETENDTTTEKSYNKNFSRFSPGWYIYPLSSDLVADGASCSLEITNITDNVVEFVIEQIGRNYSPIYISSATAVVKNDLAVFNWSDTWGNSGNGVLVFGDSFLKLTMKETHTAEFNRSSLECEERIFYPETNDLIKDDIKVILNGRELSFDQPPIMDPAGRILVPIRGIAEAIGDTVKWNDDIKTALIRHRDRALIIPLNENQLYIAASDMPYEWQTYDLDVPSQVQNGRTLTPVRAFCESLGATVEWNGDEQTAYITYKDNGISNDITDYDISGINMAYAIMRNYNVSFEDYTDEIYDFLESRNSTLDLVAMSWGGGVFDGFAQLMSGKDATETAIKESLAKVIAELPDTETGASAFKDFEEGVLGVKEIIGQSDAFDDLPKENWDIKNIDDFNKLKDIAPNADRLKKAEKATGIAIDAVGFTIEQLVYWIADYEKNLEKLDELEAYFRAAAINDDMIYEAIDDLKDEYSQKWLRTLSDFRDDVVDKGLSKAVDLATGGAFSIVNFAKDMTNNVTGLSTTADGLNRFYALCCYNGAFDLTYQKKMNDVNKWRFHGNEASDLFEWQRAVKKTIFKSMNDIANGVKEVSWDNRITELDNMTYIIWQ